MNFSLIIFIVSAFLILLLLMVRAIELRKEKFFVSKHVRTIGDEGIKNFLLAVLKNTVRIKKIIYREISLIPTRSLRITHLIWLRIKKCVDKFYEKLRR
jgi:hypothetical protein